MEIVRKKVSLVVPFYNEEGGVRHFFTRIEQISEPILDRYDFEVICINDGSNDHTFAELKAVAERLSFVRVIDLSRNFGKEAAITAGLDFAQGDSVVPMDADLQHPPEVVLEMLEKWEQGFEVVLAQRIDRSTDRRLQKITARAFYEVARHISHIDIPPDVGDFRLMDRKVVDAVKTLRESCRFMKGIFAWVGFRTSVVHYQVAARGHGKTSFSTWKLWNFALEGITSFSTVPLRVWSYIGSAISLVAFFYGAYLVLKTLMLGVDIPGYASLMIFMLFSTGIQLLGIGVLGEYLGRVFTEAKSRPIYIVRDVIN